MTLNYLEKKIQFKWHALELLFIYPVQFFQF